MTMGYFPVIIIEKYGYKVNVSTNENFMQSVTFFHEDNRELAVGDSYYIGIKVLSVLLHLYYNAHIRL